MWLVRVSVMVAVVQCASSDGGSPRLPTLSMPPFFCASAVSAFPAISTKAARTSSPYLRIWLDDMSHLPIGVAQSITSRSGRFDTPTGRGNRSAASGFRACGGPLGGGSPVGRAGADEPGPQPADRLLGAFHVRVEHGRDVEGQELRDQ